MPDPTYPNLDSEDEGPSGAMDWIVRQRQAAQSAAISGLGDSAEDAGRAQELSEATGANPALIYGNLEGFEQQHKAALTSALLTNNQYLRDYANSHPLAAKISNDDWGQLDTVSQALKPFSGSSLGKAIDAPYSVVGAAAKGFREGFGSEPMGSWLPTDAGLNKMAWAEMTAVGYPLEMAGRVFSGIVEGAKQGSVQLQTAFGTDPNVAERRSNEVAALVEAELGGLTGRHIPTEVAEPIIRQVSDAARTAKPYLDAGAEPPVGLHPVIDQVHSEQAKQDVKNLDDLFSEAQKSSTRERSPELFAHFVRQHTDSSIGIDVEALRKLYGDKVPEADDNILGWAPRIQEQMALAEAHGGDVEVPLADWLSKVDPEVAKELHDFIRVRPGGMTLDEAKEGSKPIELDAEQEENKNPYTKGEEEARPTTAPAEAPVATPADPVDSVRQAAGLKPALAPKGIVPQKTILGSVELTGADAATFSSRDAIKEIDPEQLTGVPRALHEFFADRLDKMAGDTPIWVVDNDTMNKINKEYRHPPNTPAFYDWSKHHIVMAQDVAEGQLGHGVSAHILMHEIAHAATVREMNAFPDLKAAVRSMMNETKDYHRGPGGMSGASYKPGPNEIHEYAFKNEQEFIAEAFSNPQFQEVLAKTPISKELGGELKLGGPVRSVWDAVRGIIKGLISKLTGVKDVPDSIMDGLMRLGPTFEEAQKRMKGGAAGTSAAAPREPELPGMTRVEDREPFDKAASIGMTKDQYQRYMALIDKQRAEDAEHQKAQAEKLERQRQTQEWKDNAKVVREQVSSDIRARPDIAADTLLREGNLHGEKVGKVTLDRASVPTELRKQLPEGYIGDRGVHPDDLAGLFGYQSGDAMVGGLARLEQERQLEGLTPQAHLWKLIDAETERQMRKQFGDLEQNILAEAKDHVISPTQMDLLHEELLALGTKAKGELPIKKDDLKAWIKDQFDKTPVGSHSVDKYLAAAGRAGREAEEALLDERNNDAFKAKQQQYHSMLLANEAKKLGKERAGFDKLAKRFSRREVGGVPTEYTNWIHDILQRTGNGVRRSVQDLQQAIGRESQQGLREFVEAKNNDGRIWEQDENAPSDFQVMPVAPFLFDQAYRKPVDEMSTEEFRAVNNSLKTLVKNGSDENKITVSGNKADLQETIGKMTDQLKDLFQGQEKQYAFGHKDQGVGHVVRTYWASLLQIESIFNRFDRGDPNGIFRKAITQPIFEGSHTLSTLETKYSRMYKELNFPKADLKKKVDNPLFGDPLRDGDKAPMTRANLLAVLQNVGNPGQLDKLARGYKIQNKDAIMQWLFQNTKKEDWDRAQKLGDIFEQAFGEAADMYHGLSGVSPEKIDIRPIQTPFGEYKGWYHPIVYDPLRPGSSKKLMGQDPLEAGSYYRAATPSGYTKKRTGYAAPINLNFDAVPNKLKSILNDIAMRPAVTDAAKVFYDPKWQMAMTKYYGKEVKDLMLPYLKDIAGQKTYKSAAAAAAARYLEYARQNVTATLIGLNPSTVLKHGPTAAMLSIKEVGAGNFLREVTSLLSMNDELGERNWNFAMKGGMIDGERWNGSEELQRRHRNWQETISGAQQDVFGENTLRNTVIKLGATPVAISDLLSAVPTWLAKYKLAIRAGEEHGDAVQLADTAVRRAHGSSATAARPAIMRGGPLAQLATPFYTFFNEMFQRQYEMAWRAKDAVGQFSDGDYRAGLKEVPNLAKGLWAYVIFPALIEQMVSPWVTGNKSATETVALAGLRTVASSLPVIRDAVEAFLGNRDPTIGLYSTGIKTLVDIGRDLGKGKVMFEKQNAGRLIKHTATAFGAMSGLANAQMGRTGEFVYDVATGQQRPKDTGDILRGLWHGQMKEGRR